MKKLLTIALSLVLFASACDGDAADPAPEASPALAEVPQEAPAEVPTAAEAEAGSEVQIDRSGVNVRGVEGAVRIDGEGLQVDREDGASVTVGAEGLQLQGGANPASGTSDRCSRGGCQFTCPAGETCSATCSGGGCTHVCEAGATCTFSCSGGGCTRTCAEGANCRLTCSGNRCTDS